MLSHRLLARTKVRNGGAIVENLARASAITAVAVFTGGLFLYVVLAYANDIFLGVAQHGLGPGFFRALLAILVLSTALALLQRRQRPLPPEIFLPAVVAASLILYSLYSHSLETPWISDFERMWLSAGTLVDQGRFSADDIIQQRTLPILWPAVFLFGHEPALVPVINASLLVGILLMGYDVLRQTSGHLSAQIFSILWLGGAETLYAIKIPTHDLWGLFFAAVFLWSLVTATRRARDGILYHLMFGAIIGLPVVLLEVQRELGLVALVALGTTALLIAREKHGDRPTRAHPGIRLAYLLLGASIAYATGISGLKAAGVVTTDPSYAYLSNIRTAALAPGYSDGTVRYAGSFGSTFLRSQQPEAQKETAQALLLSDFAEHPAARISGVAFKISRLGLLGSQHDFYFKGLNARNTNLAHSLTTYNKLYALLIAGLLLAALPSALTSRTSLVTTFSLALLGVLIGGLVTVGEVQPRYVFPAWLFAPLVIATHLARVHEMKGATVHALRALLPTVVIGSASVLVIVASAWFVVDHVYDPQDGRVISSFKLSGEHVEPRLGASPHQLDVRAANNRSIGIGDLGFSLVASGPTTTNSRITATRWICAGQDRLNLRFGYIMPYENPEAAGAFELKVILDDKILWSRSLPDGGNFNDIEIAGAMAPGGCGNVRFTLDINQPLHRQSWVNASLTEIYFPRLSIVSRKLPRQADTSKIELSAFRLRYSSGVIPPSESWGRSSL